MTELGKQQFTSLQPRGRLRRGGWRTGACGAGGTAGAIRRQCQPADRRGAGNRGLGLADRARPAAAQRMRGSTPIPRSRWPARSAARSRSASQAAGCSPACATSGRTGARPSSIVANIDFLGEGEEERLTSRIHGFRRGVTRYPIPGALVYPATNADLRADLRIGRALARSRSAPSIRPATSARGIYVDAMLGKHFALLGSTGTGKSTSAALILHRICEAAPQGHIVMIDPHGEYSRRVPQHRRDLRRAATSACPTG